MRVALYSRVSTIGRGQDNENQLRQLREFCAVQGWTIAGEYVDTMTGSRKDRPEFVRMFADGSRRKFDMVLFWSLDRFSREGALETMQHLQRLTSFGVGWKSFTEQYLDSCGIFKDAVLAILAVVAKQERVRIQERVKAGLARYAESGKKLGRRPVVFDRLKASELRAKGFSIRETAREMRVSKSVIERGLAEFCKKT